MDFYDEMEWRVVAARLSNRCPFDCDGQHYYLKFEASDVEIIVFPDSDTRRMAMSDPDVMKFFGSKFPMTLDAPEVENL